MTEREAAIREELVRCFQRKLISGVHLPKTPVPTRGVPMVERQAESEARWNRIYEEKFADASYYSEPRMRMRSPLASF
jgi:hypothetical protein